MKHELKILPVYFEAVLNGDKTFEIRDNRDRGIQKGDTVQLCEVRVGTVSDGYTGRKLERQITYVTNYGQKDGFVVLGMAETGASPLERAAENFVAGFICAGGDPSEAAEQGRQYLECLKAAKS